MIFVKGGKPVFFTNYNAPMYPLDLTAQDLKGTEMQDISDQSKIYVEGNYAILEKYIK